MTDHGLWVSLVSVLVGVAAIIFGWWQNRLRVRVEHMVRVELGYLAGDAVSVWQSALWADGHFQKVLGAANHNGCDASKVRWEAFMGARDVVAAERMTRLLLGHIFAVQESLFKLAEVKEAQPDVPHVRLTKIWPRAETSKKPETPAATEPVAGHDDHEDEESA